VTLLCCLRCCDACAAVLPALGGLPWPAGRCLAQRLLNRPKHCCSLQDHTAARALAASWRRRRRLWQAQVARGPRPAPAGRNVRQVGGALVAGAGVGPRGGGRSDPGGGGGGGRAGGRGGQVRLHSAGARRPAASACAGWLHVASPDRPTVAARHRWLLQVAPAQADAPQGWALAAPQAQPVPQAALPLTPPRGPGE
jgi:hypothetical protein